MMWMLALWACTPEGAEPIAPLDAVDLGAMTFDDQGVVWENTLAYGGEVLLVDASDPSVRPEGAGFVMSFTCVDYSRYPAATQICRASSDDGLDWTVDDEPLLVGTDPRGAYAWEGSQQLEGGALLASWYPSGAEGLGIAPGFPATLALIGADGKVVVDPLLAPSGIDADAAYSPATVATDDGWDMVYTAHCYAGGCGGEAAGVRMAWSRAEALEGPWAPGQPLAFEAAPDWAGQFVAEADLLWHDGSYWLAVTGFFEEKPRTIGLSRSPRLEGPYTFEPQPIVDARGTGDEVVAPSMVLDDEGLHVWYTVVRDELSRLGRVDGR